ncbi:TPA: DNA polymerase [Photobacterium damselae]
MDEATLFNDMNNMDGEPDLSAFMRNITASTIIPDTQMSNDIPLDIKSDLMTLENDIPSEPFSICLHAYQPMTLEWASGETLYVGFDTEYQYNAITGQNEIISYQTVGQTPRGQCSDIVYPKSGAKHHRWKFEALVGHLIAEMFERELLDEVPKQVVVFGHFLRADLTTFSDFWKNQKTTLRGISRTVTSAMQDYGVDVQALGKRKAGKDPHVVEAPSGEKYRTKVRFVDTLALSPNGSGLAVIGELIGLPKLELPDGYAKDEMRRFKDEQSDAFEAYAMRDAEIALAYGLRMFKFATVELGLTKCPITLGAMGVAVFQKMLKESGVDKREAFGEREITTQHWNAKLGRPHTKKELVPTDARELFEHLAIRCFMGGRNECFTCGPSDVGTYYDFDLVGAYNVGMVDIRPLDYDRAFMTTNIDAFCGHVCGFARVRFSFPDSTRFPCIAVHHDLYGLYFPLTGETYTTAPEIEVARNMGATIEILQGVVVPWKNDSEPLFLSFVQLIRKKRTSYPKKSYEESMWKEIGNSLYGKTAQGLRSKTAFELASGLSKDIPRSAVTNPYFAAHATGFIRAVISELLASVPTNRQVISVTTDGFLTDAPMNELDLTGPLCARFNAHNELVTNYLN